MVSATADNDVRAVYGRVAAGLAAFLWLASNRPEWTRPALYAVVFTLGGMASARFLSWAIVGLPEQIGLALHLGELIGFAAGIVALRRIPENAAGSSRES